MRHADTFSGFHPAVNFIYFALVLGFTMFTMNPITLALSLGAAVAYAVSLSGRKAVRFSLLFVLPMMLFTALLNPAFNHKGATILTYLPSGNPLTLESILYGLVSAMLLAAVVTWFSCYTAVMTSDKFVYLFGRVIPALSLLLSMALRFIPRFRARLRVVQQARQSMGGAARRGLLDRVREGVTVVSILVTWSLENAVDTANSMKSRGYGLPGRTAFSIYRFDSRDKAALGWMGALGVCVALAWLGGGFRHSYFPLFDLAGPGVVSVAGQLAFGLLCLTPVFYNRAAERTWNAIEREGQIV